MGDTPTYHRIQQMQAKLPTFDRLPIVSSRAFFTPLGQARATRPVVAALSTELKRKNRLSANTPAGVHQTKGWKPLHQDVSENNGFSPNHPFVNRGFPLFSPSILGGFPPIFGNPHKKVEKPPSPPGLNAANAVVPAKCPTKLLS